MVVMLSRIYFNLISYFQLFVLFLQRTISYPLPSDGHTFNIEGDPQL